MPHLVRRVRAQHVERRRDQLGLDRNGLVALFLACPQCLFDGVDSGGGVARQLNVRPKLDGLGRQSSRDRAREHGGGSGTGWVGERRKDRVLFATHAWICHR